MERQVRRRKFWFGSGVGIAAAGASVAFLIYTAVAQVAQPGLTIKSLGTNTYSITITNGVTTTNYTLFWTPALSDPIYPWEVLAVGAVGATNFNIDGGPWNISFFKAMVGDDRDGDGVPDWKDADPSNPAVGELQVIIYSPAHGSTISN